MLEKFKQNKGILLIAIIAIVLRLISINKPDGLWNDEYVSWMIASIPFNDGFVKAVKSQCHMPFYYLYLKFFMALFGQSDLLLRLTSVFAGIISVGAMYFVGKEKDKTTGLLCAGLSAISSFLIYYSQEVRLYSILFFFSAITLLYTLRCIKNPSKKNFITLGISNFLILFTHTIGFVFVFFDLLLISINLYKKYKKTITILWTCIFSGLILLSPLAWKIFTTKTFSQWWGQFSISRLGYLLTDYFSPILTNLTNAPDTFRTDLLFIICAIIPAIIALFGIIKSLKNNKVNIGLLITTILTTAILCIASITGKLVFITKYSIEIYPILIYLTCFGISELKNNKLRQILIWAYCLISLGYLIISPISAPKIRRAEGHKIMTDILERMAPQKDDIILIEYYSFDRFKKYFDFTNYRIISINKGNFPEYLSNNITYKEAYQNGKSLYKSMLLREIPNTHFSSKINNEIVKQLSPNQSIIMVTLDTVSFYPPDKVMDIVQNETMYNNTPLLFLLFSYIKEETFNTLASNLAVTRIEKKGNWTIIKFTKLKN